MNNQTKKPPMGGMGPSKGPMSVEKAKDFKGTTKKLLNNYLSNYKEVYTKYSDIVKSIDNNIKVKELNNAS